MRIFDVSMVHDFPNSDQKNTENSHFLQSVQLYLKQILLHFIFFFFACFLFFLLSLVFLLLNLIYQFWNAYFRVWIFYTDSVHWKIMPNNNIMPQNSFFFSYFFGEREQIWNYDMCQLDRISNSFYNGFDCLTLISHIEFGTKRGRMYLGQIDEHTENIFIKFWYYQHEQPRILKANNCYCCS